MDGATGVYPLADVHHRRLLIFPDWMLDYTSFDQWEDEDLSFVIAEQGR